MHRAQLDGAGGDSELVECGAAGGSVELLFDVQVSRAFHNHCQADGLNKGMRGIPQSLCRLFCVPFLAVKHQTVKEDERNGQSRVRV